MKIEQFLREQITAGTGVPAFPVFAPEYQALPFAVYMRAGTQRDRVITQAGMQPIAGFQVAIYSETYTEARDLADSLRVHLDNFTGEYGTADNNITVSYCYLVDEADGEPTQFDGESKPAYSAELSFSVKYKETC